MTPPLEVIAAGGLMCITAALSFFVFGWFEVPIVALAVWCVLLFDEAMRALTST